MPSLSRVDLRFGADLEGNLYVTTKQDGFLRRLLPETAPKVPTTVWPLQALLAAILLAAALRVRRARSAAPAAGSQPRPC